MEKMENDELKIHTEQSFRVHMHPFVLCLSAHMPLAVE